MGREMPLGAPCASLKYRNLIVTPTNLCLLCTTIRAILCAVRRILSHGWNTDETRIRRQLDALALLHPCSIRVSSVAEFGCGSTAPCLCASVVHFFRLLLRNLPPLATCSASGPSPAPGSTTGLSF